MPASLSSQDFSKKLLKWFHRHKRDLPFRQTRDPYLIWVSEIMLQQTTVSAVAPRFLQWAEKFPDIHSLANASLQKVLAQWQGLGYYNRAKNLHQTAKIICRDYNGVIPNDPVVLKSLPGFGPYTVAAVLSIAYNQCIPLIDANVRRVMMRIFVMPGKADTSHDKEILNFLEKAIPARSAGNFNQAMMEVGALLCDYKKPLCLQCPLREFCLAYKRDIQEQIPEQVKKKIIQVHAVVAIIEHQGKYFIQQRPEKGLLGGLWEFPGGKVKKGESSKAAMGRELSEELGVKLDTAQLYMKTHHFYTDFKVYLDVWKCVVSPKPAANSSRRWVSLKGFDRFPFPSGSVKIIEQLRKDVI